MGNKDLADSYEQTTIAVDFDGTIVDHRFPLIGEPVPGAFYWLHRFQVHGAKLILWTMRSDRPEGEFLQQAVEFCAENGVVFDHNNEHPQAWTTSPKAYAHVYIDDAAFGCPLKHHPFHLGRPFVDWDVVGPGVYEFITSRNEAPHA